MIIVFTFFTMNSQHKIQTPGRDRKIHLNSTHGVKQ
jgi:hypothetical protein